MATLQIEVTDQEADRLRVLETDTGKSKGELLHLALARLLAQEAGGVASFPILSEKTRLENLRAARGIWSDHLDLPDTISQV